MKALYLVLALVILTGCEDRSIAQMCDQGFGDPQEVGYCIRVNQADSAGRVYRKNAVGDAEKAKFHRMRDRKVAQIGAEWKSYRSARDSSQLAAF